MIALISLMPLSALTQTSKFTTVAVAHSYSACSKIYTRGFYNGGIAVLPHHRSIRRRVPTNLDVTSKLHYSRFLKSSATTRTLLGSSSLTLLVGQRGVHNGYPPEVEELYHGNKAYIANMSQMNPGLLKRLADKGQKPPFMLVDCSDSRVNEQGIFSARPGTIFTARNIANQFDEADPSSNAVLSYAVGTLKVKHVIVMGHYGCGGIAASMVPPPEQQSPISPSADLAIQNWIPPIRHIYQTSERLEIVAHRMKHTDTSRDENIPHLHDPAFRALVEENVKANVTKIAKSAVIREHYGFTEVYIHGWVYDVEDGQVFDLGVSVGPPGKVVPASPFPTVV